MERRWSSKIFRALPRVEPGGRERPLVTWDTEDDGQGRLDLACIYFGPERAPLSFPDREKALEWFSSRAARGLVFWAHNLEYDLNSVFGQVYRTGEPRAFRLLRRTFGGRTIGAVLQARGRSRRGQGSRPWVAWCRFANSLNIVRSSVAKIGEELGYPKLDRAAADTPAGRLEYCVRDCEIVWRKLDQVRGLVSGRFGARLRSTIGATALDVYRRNHQEATWLRRSREMDGFERRGYAGARTECFRVGLLEGPIAEYDVNSMYPWAASLPLPHPARMKWGEGVDLDLGLEGMAEATVEVPEDLAIPPLPVRWKGKLVFPTGRLRGVWTHPELRSALERGARILEVGTVLQTDVVFPYLARFVRELWELRASSRGVDHGVWKDLLNNLYGKFGQGLEVEEYWWDDDRAAKLGKMRERILSEIELAPGFRKIRLRAPVPLHAAVAWAAYITARSRVRLLELLEGARDPLYCDTDSVWCRPGSIPEGDGLGELKRSADFSRARLTAPKLYCGWDAAGAIVKCAAKGIPRRVQELYFSPGRRAPAVRWTAPVRWLESFRRGGDLNRWIDRERALAGDYDKREVLADGGTRPWRMEELERGRAEKGIGLERRALEQVAFRTNLARRVLEAGGLRDFRDRDLPAWLRRRRGAAPDDLATELGFRDEESFLDALERDVVRFYGR